MKKFTNQDFLEKARSIWNNKYSYDDAGYINMRTPIGVHCSIHGRFLQKPYDHLKGHGCQKCHLEDMANTTRLTTAKFIEKAHAMHGNTYDYSRAVYGKNNLTPVEIVCSIHGAFKQTPDDHLEGCGCPLCGRQKTSNAKRSNTIKFIKEAQQIHGERYNYENTEYVVSNEKVVVVCPIHGEFLVMPYNHLSNKNGCPQCGGSFPLTTETFIEAARKIHGDAYDYSQVNYKNMTTKVSIRCKKHDLVFEKLARSHIYDKQGCPSCSHLGSKAETEILEFVKQHYAGEVQAGVYNIIPNRQLDVYIPELKLAIEYHGQYWHSERMLEKANKNGKTYHRDKFLACQKIGVKLIQIFESEWLFKRDQVESRLLSALQLNTRVGARTLVVQSISSSEAKQFLNSFHIQGYNQQGNVNIGLYDKTDLLSVMSFSKPRFANYEWELIRFATKKGITIVGGASKLFSMFVNTYHPTSVISYGDFRYGSGNVYKQIGFSFQRHSFPNYFYYKMNDLKLLSRNKFQKHKLLKLLEHFDISKTEVENMYAHGFDRIFDAGNAVYVWTLTPSSNCSTLPS